MKIIKIIFVSAFLCSAFMLTGCSLFTKDNANTNIIVQNENTDQTVNANILNVNADSNENTNINVDTEVDTSDWQTYTNEEYGFSFKHPSDWNISKNIFEIYKKSYDNLRYQINEKDIVFLTSLNREEIYNEINKYKNQTNGMNSGIIESVGKGKLISVNVSELAVSDLVNEPGFTFVIGDSIKLNKNIEAVNVYLKKRWEGNSDYHYIYIPFQSSKLTNTDKIIKSIVFSIETNNSNYEQDVLLKIIKTFQK